MFCESSVRLTQETQYPITYDLPTTQKHLQVQVYMYTGYLIALHLTLLSLNPTVTAAPEPGFSAAAEDGGGQWGGGNLAAATRDVQVSGVRGNGGRGDGAGAEAAGGSCGGATAQIGSQPDGQNAGEEGGINSDQKAVMAGAGSAAVAKHSVREGGGRAVVTAANQGQIASDAPGSGVKCCFACRCTIVCVCVCVCVVAFRVCLSAPYL